MTASSKHYAQLRHDMVATIEAIVEETAADIGKQHLSPAVMAAIDSVPRHQFVPASCRDQAYRDSPLPIGYEQTISQPYMVALMTDLLNPQPDHVVLEVGTGSGYQAAILSQLVKHVYSIEIVAPLAASAEKTLHQLGYRNVSVFAGNGYAGLPEYAPYDGIIVTAGGEIPAPLVEQLKVGGRMLIPVAEADGAQYLTLLKKSADTELVSEKILRVRFVPLAGKNH